MPRPGVTPFSFRAATRAVRSDLIAAAVALPSRIWAVMGPIFADDGLPDPIRPPLGHPRTVRLQVSRPAGLPASTPALRPVGGPVARPVPGSVAAPSADEAPAFADAA
ncbi:hypothetical protein GCM10027075_55200 [Streptomyces heilongjiangensis]